MNAHQASPRLVASLLGVSLAQSDSVHQHSVEMDGCTGSVAIAFETGQARALVRSAGRGAQRVCWTRVGLLTHCGSCGGAVEHRQEGRLASVDHAADGRGIGDQRLELRRQSLRAAGRRVGDEHDRDARVVRAAEHLGDPHGDAADAKRGRQAVQERGDVGRLGGRAPAERHGRAHDLLVSGGAASVGEGPKVSLHAHEHRGGVAAARHERGHRRGARGGAARAAAQRIQAIGVDREVLLVAAIRGAGLDGQDGEALFGQGLELRHVDREPVGAVRHHRVPQRRALHGAVRQRARSAIGGGAARRVELRGDAADGRGARVGAAGAVLRLDGDRCGQDKEGSAEGLEAEQPHRQRSPRPQPRLS